MKKTEYRRKNVFRYLSETAKCGYRLMDEALGMAEKVKSGDEKTLKAKRSYIIVEAEKVKAWKEVFRTIEAIALEIGYNKSVGGLKDDKDDVSASGES